MTLPLRAAGPRDAEGIAALLARCLPDPWSAAMVEESLVHGVLGWIAGQGEPLAGVLLLQVVVPEAEILQVAVAPELRRLGLGRELVRRALAESARAGVTDVFLEARPGNHAAQALYLAEGFAHAGRRRAYYSNGEDACVMTRRLAFALPGPGQSPA